MTRVVSRDEFVDAVREVLNERGPDFVYDRATMGGEGGGCVYSGDAGDTGACLYGVVLIEKIGVPYQEDWEGMTISQIIDTMSHELLPEGWAFNLPHNVVRAAYESQRDQDNAYSYDRVGNEFEKYVASPDGVVD